MESESESGGELGVRVCSELGVGNFSEADTSYPKDLSLEFLIYVRTNFLVRNLFPDVYIFP